MEATNWAKTPSKAKPKKPISVIVSSNHDLAAKYKINITLYHNGKQMLMKMTLKRAKRLVRLLQDAINRIETHEKILTNEQT